MHDNEENYYFYLLFFYFFVSIHKRRRTHNTQHLCLNARVMEGLSRIQSCQDKDTSKHVPQSLKIAVISPQGIGRFHYDVPGTGAPPVMT